jgi:Lipocalin-like domain
MTALAVRSKYVAFTALLVALFIPAASNSSPGLPKNIVGSYRLLSVEASVFNRGPHPTGILIYDGFGNMSAQIMPDRDRPNFSQGGPTGDEAKAAIDGYTAYFGTYVDEKVKIIVHHVKGGINPGSVNHDETRGYEISGNHLTLINRYAGSEQVTHVVWERIQ